MSEIVSFLKEVFLINLLLLEYQSNGEGATRVDFNLLFIRTGIILSLNLF